MGASLFIVFTQLYTGVPLGRRAQILGHVTFTLSFVVVIVRGRLAAIGPVYEEAARDLGANAGQALRLVILPLLWPAIFASVVIVFATSMDDFVIASFLSSGARHRDRSHSHLRLRPRRRHARPSTRWPRSCCSSP